MKSDQLVKDLKYYQCPMGMVSNSIHPESRTWDNPGLFTAQAINLGQILDRGSTFILNEDVRDFILKSRTSWTRWPVDGGQFTGGPPSHDELFAWAALMPRWMLRDHGGLDLKIKTMSPGELRFVDLIPFVKMSMGYRLSLLEQIMWSAVTIMSCRTGYPDTSGKCKKWVQLRQMKQTNYWLCNLAISHWQRVMTKMYKRGLKDLFDVYFGPDHPLSKNAPEDFNLGL